MQKKGELSSLFTVGAIVAIIGIIILVFLLPKIGEYFVKKYSEEQICESSVLIRATSPEAAKSDIPLKCTTKKYCVTTDKDKECPQLLYEQNKETIDLPSNTNEAARKIEEITAESMYTCWKQMGEGKLDIFGPDGSLKTNILANKFSVQEVKPKCVICKRIVFSEDLVKNKPEILQNVDVKSYIEKTQIPGSSFTYLQKFTGNQVTSYPAGLSEALDPQDTKATNDIAVIFMQVIAKNEAPIVAALETGENTALAIGGGIFLNPFGKFFKVAALKVAAVAIILGFIGSGTIAFIQQQKNQDVAITHCDKFVGPSEEPRYGCSIVTLVDYKNLTKINELCNGGIEGNL